MKELTIEQKAQRYNEALKKAKDFYKGYKQRDNQLYADDLESIFPELAESEDEEIRKSIIAILKNYVDDSNTFKSKMITWLEKQTEQKSIDKVELTDYNSIDPHFGKLVGKAEPKFKVGDWIIYEDNIWKICNISLKTYYELLKINNEVSIRHFEGVDKTAHLWTIQDAKDGDVLMANAPFIFNGNLEGGIGCPGAHCGINTLGKFQIPKDKKHWTGHITTPATKEQCDLLFQKMHEAGYEWDSEKKELKKIEQRSTDKIEPIFNVGDKIQYSKDCGTIMTIEKIENGEYIFGNNMGHTTIENGNKWYLVNHVEQNTAWNEGDENRINRLIAYFEDKESFTAEDDIVYANWLKSLRPQKQ